MKHLFLSLVAISAFGCSGEGKQGEASLKLVELEEKHLTLAPSDRIKIEAQVRNCSRKLHLYTVIGGVFELANSQETLERELGRSKFNGPAYSAKRSETSYVRKLEDFGEIAHRIARNDPSVLLRRSHEKTELEYLKALTIYIYDDITNAQWITGSSDRLLTKATLPLEVTSYSSVEIDLSSLGHATSQMKAASECGSAVLEFDKYKKSGEPLEAEE